ncbi:hypothetical protein GCM10023092_25350 [Rurimicrobium arvi]|uniref:Uncharacterized protein n=2 Tax=Rurimicrobium arvi TaxID=2049916 RepID=A0ABP8N1D0_9BACT
MSFGHYLIVGHHKFYKEANLYIINNKDMHSNAALLAYASNSEIDLDQQRTHKNLISKSANLELVNQLAIFVKNLRERASKEISINASKEEKLKSWSFFLMDACHGLVKDFPDKSALVVIRKYDSKEDKMLTIASSNNITTLVTPKEEELIKQSFHQRYSLIRLSPTSKASLPLPSEGDKSEIVVKCINGEDGPNLSLYMAIKGENAEDLVDLILKFEVLDDFCIAIDEKYGNVHLPKGNNSKTATTNVDYMRG